MVLCLRRLLSLSVALAVLWLSGCATPMRTQDAAFQGLPVRTELTATPFFPQEAHQCGPASLATALAAAGYPADLGKLGQQVYLPGREGSLQAEMLAGARRQAGRPAR